MLSSVDSPRVHLACGATDMRKSIDGLAAIVTHTFELNPFDTSLFVFCNRDRDKLKILRWDTPTLMLRDTMGRLRCTQQPSAVTKRLCSF